MNEFMAKTYHALETIKEIRTDMAQTKRWTNVEKWNETKRDLIFIKNTAVTTDEKMIMKQLLKAFNLK